MIVFRAGDRASPVSLHGRLLVRSLSRPAAEYQPPRTGVAVPDLVPRPVERRAQQFVMALPQHINRRPPAAGPWGGDGPVALMGAAQPRVSYPRSRFVNIKGAAAADWARSWCATMSYGNQVGKQRVLPEAEPDRFDGRIGVQCPEPGERRFMRMGW